MNVNPYLSFNGQCREAFELYASCFEGSITFIVPWGETPAAETVPPDWQSKIIHATLLLGGQTLQGADAPPGQYEAPKGFSLSLTAKDEAEAKRFFELLAEGGAIRMPVQQTFWAPAFGMLVDRFGIPWMIQCGRFSVDDSVWMVQCG